MFDAAVVGCGIAGAALAFELSRREMTVAVLESGNDAACGASRANSGILHAGYDPPPGTLMAKLNVRGAAIAKKWCERLSVPYLQCGSLVAAFSRGEEETLRELARRGARNGVRGLELWDAKTLRRMEPNIAGDAVGALYAPTAAVVNPWEYTLALAQAAVRGGARLLTGHRVEAIRRTEGGYRLFAAGKAIDARFVFNAAGARADTVHNMVSAPAFRCLPSRGEYYLLDKSEGARVRHIVFRCPTSSGKGVLTAPTVHGNLIVGPCSEPCAAGDTATTAAGLEYVRRAALRAVPSIRFGENIRAFAGVRAVTDRDDFIIEQCADAPGFFDIAGIKSPGLTAAPAIAQMAVRLLRGAGFAPRLRKGAVTSREKIVFSALSPAQKAELCAQSPDYGQVVCRCETVTEGEIRAAFRAPIPPRSVDGVKRRCGAGMGRCQGGFCGPRVVQLLAEEMGVSPAAVPQDADGSYILSGETKVGGGD